MIFIIVFPCFLRVYEEGRERQGGREQRRMIEIVRWMSMLPPKSRAKDQQMVHHTSSCAMIDTDNRWT